MLYIWTIHWNYTLRLYIVSTYTDCPLDNLRDCGIRWFSFLKSFRVRVIQSASNHISAIHCAISSTIQIRISVWIWAHSVIIRKSYRPSQSRTVFQNNSHSSRSPKLTAKVKRQSQCKNDNFVSYKICTKSQMRDQGKIIVLIIISLLSSSYKIEK